MSSYIVDNALLPSGWHPRVRLEVDSTGYLLSVEPDSEPRDDDERIRGAVLPGVPNLHSHAFQRAMAGLAERGSSSHDTFWTWRELMYRFLQNLGPDDVEAVAAQLFVEMLKAGYTSVGEFHYLHHDRNGEPFDDPAEMSLRVISAAREAGIGLTFLPSLYTSGDFGGAPPTDGQKRFLLSVEDLLRLVTRLRGETTEDPRHRIGVALHSLRAVSPEELRTCVAGVQHLDPDAPIHLHVAEQTREVEDCLAWSGARPVEWLLDHAPVGPSWCLVHATHLVESEVEGLANSSAVVGLCPSTEANLGDGIFPLADFLGLEGRFGIGSDAHVSVSPVEELRWLEYVQRLTHRERNMAAGHREASTGAILFSWALAGGAMALGQRIGAVAPGARADLLVLEPDHPILAGREDDDRLDAWIFSGNRNPVRDVMVAGDWVVRDGRHPGEEEIRARYVSTAKRLA